MERSSARMLHILGFACTVVLVEAKSTLDFPGCGEVIHAYVKANGYRNYMLPGVLFVHGEDQHTGTLISPKHVLVKTPKTQSFDFDTARVWLRTNRLNQKGNTPVLESARCGSYTVVTLEKGSSPNWLIWNCLAGFSKGDQLPQGVNHLYGFNPKTSYAEMTEFSVRGRQRTCRRNGMVAIGKVTDGPFRFKVGIKDLNLTAHLPKIKLQAPHFILNVPDETRSGNWISGHFDKWIGGGEGQFEFKFTLITDDEIKCIKKIVLPLP